MAVTTLDPFHAARSATFDRVIVDGRILPLNYVASVRPGDTLSLTVTTDYPLRNTYDYALLEVGQPPSGEMLIDHFARELALRRPA